MNIKEYIKQLSQEQKELKKQRKTGTLEFKKKPSHWGDCFYYIPTIDSREKINDSGNAARKVQDNRPKITAALNLYHELKGSDYRHKINDHYAYERAYEELKGSVAQTTEPRVGAEVAGENPV